MYSSGNLVVFNECCEECKKQVFRCIESAETPFKELNSLTLAFSAMKNPQNYVVFILNSPQTLHSVENISKSCHNYQQRVFIVFENTDLEDNFFTYFCDFGNLYKLTSFIQNHILLQNLESQNQPSKLLQKLIELELKNMGLSYKYVGFKYLVCLASTALGKNFYSNNYIDFFEYTSRTHLVSIDTIEKDVRHMLVSSWKKSEKFKSIVQNQPIPLKKINARTLLNAVLMHLKNVV